MQKRILEIQNKIEKKFQNLNNISFESFLMALIGGCGVQAAIQFLTIKYPEPWQEELELELLNDPAFYFGLMLTFLIALLIIRKWKKLIPFI